MKIRIECVVAGALAVAPFAGARPPVVSTNPSGETTVWLPGANAPRDIAGNSAVFNAPRRASAAGGEGQGGLRGVPSWAPFGPSGADAESITASPTAPGVLVAGIASAVGGGAIYRTSDNGASWSITSGTGTRAVNEVEFASTGAAWAATGNGLFTSTDSGQNWTEVFLPITGQALVEDVAVDPTNASNLWVGLGQFLNETSPSVVFKSTDGGATWTDVSPPVTPGLGATVVAVNPWNSQHVYAAFTGNFGAGNELWVTTDGGASWTERSDGLPDNIINDVDFAPGGAVYIAGGQDFGSQFVGLYSTTDDGLNWNDLSAAWPSRAARGVAVDPANAQNILVGTTRAGLVRSTDGGATWTYSVGGTGSYQVNDAEFVPGSPSNIFLGMGSVAVFRSTNGGASFSPASSGMSSLELTSFAVNPTNPSEIAASYVGSNDGGIFTTTDGGATWTLSQAPLPRWQKVYFAPNGTLYGTHDGPLGRADDGLWVRNPDGTWTGMGPGSPSALDTIGLEIAATTGENPVILLGGYRWLGTWGAQIWSYGRIAPQTWELENDGAFAFEEVFSLQWLNGGAGPGVLAGIVNFGSDGAGGILRSSDSGDTWAPSETGYIPTWNAWEIVQGPQDENTVYVNATSTTGSADGSIFKSTDGGLSWTQQGLTPAARQFATDPEVPGTFFIHPTWTGTGPQRSTDDGATFETFNAGFINTSGARDMVYGGTVGGVRRLYAATTSGGFATELAGGGNPCPADWNGDETVNSNDISAFLTAWLDSVQNGNLIADFNADQAVNSNDISAFLTAWLDAVQNGC